MPKIIHYYPQFLKKNIVWNIGETEKKADKDKLPWVLFSSKIPLNGGLILFNVLCANSDHAGITSGSDESLTNTATAAANHIPASNTANERRNWKHLAIPESFEDVDSPIHANANQLCNHLSNKTSSHNISNSLEQEPKRKQGIIMDDAIFLEIDESCSSSL